METTTPTVEREKLILTKEEHELMCAEEYTEFRGEKIEFVEHKYEDTRRHTEVHSLVFKRQSDNKCFRVIYETSVKDSMGWDDCNYGETFEAIEVFPKIIETTVYE